MSNNFLTWRTYRDRDQAPVPVLRAVGRRSAADARHLYETYSWTPARQERGDRLVVGPFTRGFGLYTGAVWEHTDELPAVSMAEEPVLLQHRGRYRLAKPTGERRGEGPDPYHEPTLTFEDGAPVLFVPGHAVSTGYDGEQRVVCPALGRGVYRTRRGLTQAPRHVMVGGGASVPSFDYDPYHGALLLLNERGEPMEDQLVQATVPLGESYFRNLADLGEGVYTIMKTADGRVSLEEDEEATILGYVVVGSARLFQDTRRAAPVKADENRYGRVGYGQLDGSPLSDGHMWVIETNAPPGLVADAVHHTLPAGSLIRLITPTEGIVGAHPEPESGGYILTEDGIIISTENDGPLVR